MSFDGMRVLAFETRRSAEIAALIRNQGGEPFVAPSVREVPLERNEEALAFYDRLRAGEFDMVVLLTGVGVRALNGVIATRYGETALGDALRKVTVVARGPKPAAVLREWNVPIGINVPEPNTWREILAATEERTERRIAIQEYGVSNERLIDGLCRRGAEVTQVRVYQYELPEDTRPLREAVRRLSAGEIDVALFTTSAQMYHLMQIASEEGAVEQTSAGLRRCVIAAIGPTTSETLDEFGFKPDVVPSHPKMGFLVKETAEVAPDILKKKRP
jgi:uroporphyrinogen-III synthase